MSIAYAHDKDVLFLPNSDIETEYHWISRGDILTYPCGEFIFPGVRVVNGLAAPSKNVACALRWGVFSPVKTLSHLSGPLLLGVVFERVREFCAARRSGWQAS